MKVTNISTHVNGTHTTFSADFIFSHPYGGKKRLIVFWIKLGIQLCTQPLHVLKFGYSERHRVWYTLPTQNAQKENRENAFFTIALPLAVAMNEDLDFEGSVSPEILEKSLHVQQFYHEVAKRTIRVQTSGVQEVTQWKEKLGQFFTLGVDSFYTLCCFPHTKRPTKRLLIYVDGYDVPFYEKRFLNTIHQNIKTVAAGTNNKTLFIETNLRQISDEIIGWGRFHVSGLVAASMFAGIQKIFISGESFDAADWGLRTGVDRIYSSKSQTIQLVGHAYPRLQKIKHILETPYSRLFLQFVRVCWENIRQPNVPYNCSNCQKCLKTQLQLYSLGIFQPPTFQSLDPRNIERISLVAHVYPEWAELVQVLRKSQVNPSILRALKNVLKKPVRA